MFENNEQRRTLGREIWRTLGFGLGAFLSTILGIAIVFQLGDRGPERTQADPDEYPISAPADIPTSAPEGPVASLVGPSITDPSASRIQASISQYSNADDGTGSWDSLELDAERLRLLHAAQELDVQQMLDDLDATVIESADGTVLTVREIRAMHEQQRRDLETAYDAEVVIPGRADGSPPLTVADLRATHAIQEEAILAASAADEVIIAGGSANGGANLTRAEIAALHQSQRAGSDSDQVMRDYAVPVGKDGGYTWTVDQLRQLHESQRPE